MLQHFNECIKQAKSSRQQAVQMNIFTAVLCALKVCTHIMKLSPKKSNRHQTILHRLSQFSNYDQIVCYKIVFL